MKLKFSLNEDWIKEYVYTVSFIVELGRGIDDLECRALNLIKRNKDNVIISRKYNASSDLDFTYLKDPLHKKLPNYIFYWDDDKFFIELDCPKDDIVLLKLKMYEIFSELKWEHIDDC